MENGQSQFVSDINFLRLLNFVHLSVYLVNSKLKFLIQFIVEKLMSAEELFSFDYSSYFDEGNSTSVFQDTIGILPFNRAMVSQRVSVSFLLNFDLVLSLILAIVLFYGALRLTHLIMKKKFFMKLEAIGKIEQILSLFELKYFLVLLNKTFFPFVMAFLLQIQCFQSASKV